MNFSFVRVSNNSKTGPIPVTGTSKDSCPNSCPLKKNGCYAEMGRLNIHWNRLSKKGLDLAGLVGKIKQIPIGRLWRHNQMGDLPGDGERIDGGSLREIVAANKGKKGFTYTHYSPHDSHNRREIENANRGGFTVNLSADNLKEADEFMALGVAPVVVVLPIDAKNCSTPAGNRVVVCPATKSNVQCMDCQLCQKRDRKFVIGFPAHGIRKKHVEKMSKGN